MAAQDSTTTDLLQERTEVIQRLTAIRAIGDLLTAAADSVGKGRSELHEQTLASLGMHLEDLATEALVILRHEKPRPAPAMVEARRQEAKVV
jgi:hypothetical protein